MSDGDTPRPGGAIDEVAAAKAALRRRLRERLAAIDPQAAQAAAGKVAQRLLALPEVRGARGILSCLSFGSELDTWQLVDRLVDAGRKVYVPRTERRTRKLRVHPYPCALRTTGFGLREPLRGTPEIPEDAIAAHLDVVLILGLGFDPQGYRLGYGGGYFDRFLDRHRLVAIGLGYAAQIEDAVPRAPHDRPMSLVVTEQGVLRPQAVDRR